MSDDNRPRRFFAKTALVTGAAAGIGAAVAQAFAREGANVVIADIDDARGQALAKDLTGQGHSAIYVHADTTSGNDVRNMVHTAVDTFGGLDIGVNNTGNLAGGDHAGLRIHEATEEQWDGTIGISQRSVFLSMKYELDVMVAQGSGVIVNTSSIFGLTVSPKEFNTPAYTTAKAGIQQLTRLAAIDYAKDGIRVNAIAPGITATPGVLIDLPKKEDRDELAQVQPISRMIEPIEQAYAVLFLASDEAQMISGQTLAVDGGWSAL
jgi:NAD(P)-dependent dehydrogenase (short-subunit alcohol dehydrogenase family)